MVISDFAIKRPVVTIVAMLTLVVFGVFALFKLKTDEFPDVNPPFVTVALIYPGASPDGLRGSEGTFSLCTFSYVNALAGAGQLDKARVTFEKMLTYANHLGLYSEEIGPTGEQLGNFPQAFTHMSLIMAASTLDEALDRQRQRD